MIFAAAVDVAIGGMELGGRGIRARAQPLNDMVV